MKCESAPPPFPTKILHNVEHVELESTSDLPKVFLPFFNPPDNLFLVYVSRNRTFSLSVVCFRHQKTALAGTLKSHRLPQIQIRPGRNCINWRKVLFSRTVPSLQPVNLVSILFVKIKFDFHKWWCGRVVKAQCFKSYRVYRRGFQPNRRNCQLRANSQLSCPSFRCR